MIEACSANKKITLVQHLDPDSEESEEHPTFTFGDFTIDLVNYDEDFMDGSKTDCNEFSLGLLASANGHRIFIPSDIGNDDGDLDRLLRKYDLDNLDVLVSNHHGYKDDNPFSYLEEVNPDYYLQTAKFSIMDAEMTQLLAKMGCKVYSAGGYHDILSSLSVDFSETEVTCNADKTWQIYTNRAGTKSAYYDGMPYSGFFSYNGDNYYAGEDGILKTDTIWTDASTNIQYTFDADGKITNSGEAVTWTESNGTWYYQNTDGSYATGWIVYDNATYYLDDQGQMKTGWQYINGSWYYFYDWGGLFTGWLEQNGHRYYLPADQGGAMQTEQWATDESQRYCYLQSWGAAAAGCTLKIGNYSYQFDASGYVINIQWLDLDGATYLLTDSMPYVGWAQMKNGYYYLNEDGRLQKNLLFSFEDNLYYVDETGLMAADGWRDIDGKRYYFQNWGGALTYCWFHDQGHTYYLNKDGSMQTGWMVLGDNTYYFGDDGVMYTGKKNVDGKTYIFTENGVLK